MAKFDKMARYLPSLLKPETNTYVKGVLYSWSEEDDIVVEQIQEAKRQIYVKYANLNYLDALGSNVGVFRPAAVNLNDDQFRALIPALSFDPKQVKPTIRKILDAFFGAGNPRVKIVEVGFNEIIIQIPSSVPALRRTLKGSHHFNSNSGLISSIDNIGKTVTVDMYSKVAKSDEYRYAKIGQGLNSFPVLSNSAGSTCVFQFSAGYDLSVLNIGERIVVSNVPNYRGSFIPDPTKAYSVTRYRGTIGQTITAGNIYPNLIMQDASGIPDAPGRLIFNFGRNNREADIKYFGRPNNTTLLLDPAYVFQKDHVAGEVVNVIVKPYNTPRINGDDYSVYLVGITAARILAQDIVKSAVAAGVVIKWRVVDPEC